MATVGAKEPPAVRALVATLARLGGTASASEAELNRLVTGAIRLLPPAGTASLNSWQCGTVPARIRFVATTKGEVG